jgi:hypothetical protein
VTDPTEIPAAPTARSTTPSTSPSTAPSIAGRYGSDRPRRRVAGIALGGLLALALLAWAVWVMSEQGREPIEASVSSYDVIGTHEVRVKVLAHFRDDHVDGSCLVRATAEDRTTVGELNLTADQLRADRGRWISIRTERRATTATVVRCG